MKPYHACAAKGYNPRQQIPELRVCKRIVVWDSGPLQHTITVPVSNTMWSNVTFCAYYIMYVTSTAVTARTRRPRR